MTYIKSILDNIRDTQGNNAKQAIIESHKDDELFKKVIYLGLSGRVKFFQKIIPSYESLNKPTHTLEQAVDSLTSLSSRLFTGAAAKTHLALILSTLHSDDAVVIEQIIKKDFKLGVGTTICNKVFGKDYIEKVAYMGASSYKEELIHGVLGSKPIKEDQIVDGKKKKVIIGYTKPTRAARSQVKMDGRFSNVKVEDGVVFLESRAGEVSYLASAKFVKEFSYFPDGVYNGELTIPGVDRNTSNGIINSLISIGQKESEGYDVTEDIADVEKDRGVDYQTALDSIVYTIWDGISINDFDAGISNTIYSNRLDTLHSILNMEIPTSIRMVEEKLVHTFQEALEHFREMLERGEEGTILKSFECQWKSGKGKESIKMKLEIFTDFNIVGFKYGAVGTKDEHVINSLVVHSTDDVVKTRAAGIKDKDKIYITENMDSLLGTIVEIKSCGLSNDRHGNYALLHPRFVSFRSDKNTGDDFKSTQAIHNAALMLGKEIEKL